MKPRISVCVPIYNGMKYLRECLESIQAQTFEDFEIILVDDHSSDESAELARQYARADRRIRVYLNDENLGLAGNWNRCLDYAEGDWIKFVCQDDRIAPACLEVLLAASRPDVPITVCQREWLFDGVSAAIRGSYEELSTQFQIVKLFPGLDHVPAEKFSHVSLANLGINFIGEPTAVLLHHDALRRFGKFNADFVQLCDFEYWARIAGHTGFVFVPQTLASFRVHSESASASNAAFRSFHYDVIDVLLLAYSYAYDPRFAPVRAIARRDGFNLRRIVAERAHRAASLARQDAHDPLVADPRPLEEWNAVVSRYPKLQRSAYRHLYSIQDKFHRHVLWRFRREEVRSGDQASHTLPVVVIIDMEPDAFFTKRESPLPWTGYEAAYEFLRSIRAPLELATGSPAKFCWTLRFDPQIEETYGSADWAVHRYAQEITECQSVGDEFGVHTHAFRWDSSRGDWVVDHGNQSWVDYCVTSSMANFSKAFGRSCRTFRFGDGWMNNETMRLIEKLGAEFDLTLEPGQPPSPAVFPEKPFTGSLPDLRNIPVSPYHPDREDFTKSDPMRGHGIWVIPLSAGPLRANVTPSLAEAGHNAYQTLNLGCEPEDFSQLVHRILTVLHLPYLTLIARSDIGTSPRLLHNLKANFSTLIRHPRVGKWVFCTPAEAMNRLGYKSGEAERGENTHQQSAKAFAATSLI